jgi:hypothetical protein
VGKESISGLKSDAASVGLSLRLAGDDNVLDFAGKPDLQLGPVTSVLAPSPGEGLAKGREASPIRLGNVTFNQAANSLNVWKTNAPKDGDLSRQLPVEAANRNATQTSDIAGWAIVGLAAFAIIIAMAIGYYENDRDDRTRRRSSRRKKRRHRRTT